GCSAGGEGSGTAAGSGRDGTVCSGSATSGWLSAGAAGVVAGASVPAAGAASSGRTLSGWSLPKEKTFLMKPRAMARPVSCRRGLGRNELPAGHGGDFGLDDGTGIPGHAGYRNEALGTAGRCRLDQDALAGADKAVNMRRIGGIADRAQPRSALPDRQAVDLRHARRRRALARAEREDVQMGQPAIGDDGERVAEHLLGLGRKAGDQVGPEDDLRPPGAEFGADADRIAAAVTSLHPRPGHRV